MSFLKQYGQLKTENLRRLYYSDEGYSYIERSIRVAEFVSLDRDLPRKLVTQGLEIFFKYLGQPVSCYRCGSTDHVVKDCHANAVRGHESHLSGNPGERPRLLRPPPLPVMKPPWTQKPGQPPNPIHHLRLPILQILKRPKQHHQLAMQKQTTLPSSSLLTL